MIHAILHVLGVDTQQSYWYDWWSGIATQASLVTVAWGAYRRNNCKKHLCLRLGHFELTDPDTQITRLLCWKHHPGVPHRHLKMHHIEEIFRKQQS